jgi:hypothetical protein
MTSRVVQVADAQTSNGARRRRNGRTGAGFKRPTGKECRGAMGMLTVSERSSWLRIRRASPRPEGGVERMQDGQL